MLSSGDAFSYHTVELTAWLHTSSGASLQDSLQRCPPEEGWSRDGAEAVPCFHELFLQRFPMLGFTLHLFPPNFKMHLSNCIWTCCSLLEFRVPPRSCTVTESPARAAKRWHPTQAWVDKCSATTHKKAGRLLVNAVMKTTTMKRFQGRCSLCTPRLSSTCLLCVPKINSNAFC